MKKKIALLGGSFDPVHNGHIAMAEAALENLGVDEVWFIPALHSPLKHRVLSNAADRLNMLRLVCRDHPNFKICDAELRRNGVSYTVDTLETLRNRYPDFEFIWLLGADQAANFSHWKHPERLQELAKFAVADRDENLRKNGIPDGFLELPMEPVDVSSTEIRHGRRLNQMPEAIRQYLLDQEMFLVQWIQPQMSKARFAHSNSVARLCRELAAAHGFDPHKAWLAGLFHDIAKDMPRNEQEKWIRAVFPQSISEHQAIWHGYVGSEVISRIYGIYDPMIKNAIGSHVKGTSYDPYAMMVFIADKLDPLRGYDSSGLYKACLHDLYNGFLLVKAENKNFLEKERKAKHGTL